MLFQAGISEDGRNLGAHIADGLFAGVENFEDAQEYYADVKARAAALGRDPDQIHVMPGLSPIIEDTDEEAWARIEDRKERLDLDKLLCNWAGPSAITTSASTRWTSPFPDVSNLSLNSYKGFAERILRRVKAGNLTLRQAALQMGSRRQNFVGSPETVADEIERWFVERAADGFNLQISRPSDFAKFREKVIPILQARGLFKTEYQHDTLRGHLGLPVPENRWARERRIGLQAAE